MPLSPERWYAYFDQEGRINDVDGLKKEIFLGVRVSSNAFVLFVFLTFFFFLPFLQGVYPDIRVTVWKFLLCVFPFDSTEAEREFLREERRAEYEVLKKQWTTISPIQEQYFSKFRERRHRIGLIILLVTLATSQARLDLIVALVVF